VRSRFRQALTQPDPNLNGPTIVVVRLRKGVPAAVGLASLQSVAEVADKVMAADPEGAGDTYNVLGVQRPAEIVNYQSTGDTPAVLAAGLAAGAVVALGIMLAASVRRRRRDLAVLKTLGFTRRQLAVTVAWQASVAAIVGIVVGVPTGLALGRWLWDLFRPGHLRRAPSDGARARGRPRRRGHDRPHEPGRRHPGAHGGPDPDRARAAGRMSRVVRSFGP
jgi:hypothetical protein